MSKSIEKQLLALLKQPDYRPMSKSELAHSLGVSTAERPRLRELLANLEKKGKLSRLKKGRYGPPREKEKRSKDQIVGTIRFQLKGHAFFFPDHTAEENQVHAELLEDITRVFVAPPDTGTALTGDRVVLGLDPSTLPGSNLGRGRREGLGPEGRVLEVIERGHGKIVGTLVERGDFRHCVPREKRLPPTLELLPSSVGEKARDGDVIVVALDEWKSPHQIPRGHIVKVLGRPEDPGVDILSILHKHGLTQKFPVAVAAEAEAIGPRVSVSETKHREDWRQREVFTIDPDDARDFDDAICVTDLEGGGWELAVHIADVSHYVKPGTALDKEARARGNSTYLVDRVIPMLPEKLSNGICSLVPGEDRLTRAAILCFDSRGKMVETRFVAAVIHSKARFSYEQAFEILEPLLAGGNAVPGPVPAGMENVPKTLSAHLGRAWKLAALLRENRFREGGLDLDMPEVKVIVDDKGEAVDMVRVEYDASHQLIEEFMLAANEAVARVIKERQLPCIYRIHEDPDANKLYEFRELARIHEYHIGDLRERGEIGKLLKMIKGQPEERLIKIGLLKSLKRAAYHANPLGHYGLAKADYTHFTSPIRRYADLVVHRVLANFIYRVEKKAAKRTILEKTVTPGYTDLVATARHISETERSSADAEEESKRLKQLEFFERLANEDGGGRKFKALILEVARMGVFIELTDFFVRGLVKREDFPPNSDWYFDLGSQAVIGRKPRITIRPGEEVEVEVALVNLEKMFIDFRIVSGGSEGGGPRRGRGAKKRPPGKKKTSSDAPTSKKKSPPRRRRRRSR
ncbi:MAG: ribonuclease R [Verrucomicrobiales bacterium]